MPKKKKTAKRSKTNKKLNIVKIIKGKQKLIFVVLFALFGAFLLYRTFAASTTVSYDVRLTSSQQTASYQITAANGELVTTLKTTDRKLKLEIEDSKGSVIASATPDRGKTYNQNGTIEVRIQVTPDTYTVRVSYDGKLKGTVDTKLTITYPIEDPETPRDTTPPTAVITSPTGGTVSGLVTVKASATDSSGIDKVEFYVNGKLLATDTTSSYQAVWDTSKFVNDTHNLSVKAYDTFGNIGNAGLTIIVKNESTPPPISSGDGIWISRDELMALPASGDPWDNMYKRAVVNGLESSGALENRVGLHENDNKHDTNVLGLAYRSVRLGDAVGVERVVSEISTVPGSDRERALPFCRNITAYIIAADVIDLSSKNSQVDKQFREFIQYWILEDETLQGHSGSSIKGTAAKSPNNWGGMCRAAYSAAALYLGDTTALDNVTKWHKGFLGDNTTYNGMVYQDTNWHADINNKRGINGPGATIQGQNVDGVIPEDQRRGGEFTWPAPKENYVYEGLQGALVTDVVLQRAGKITPYHYSSALVRAYRWLHNSNGYPAGDDDRWQMWVVNKQYNQSFPTTTSTGVTAGKLMGWTDWTHQ